MRCPFAWKASPRFAKLGAPPMSLHQALLLETYEPDKLRETCCHDLCYIWVFQCRESVWLSVDATDACAQHFGALPICVPDPSSVQPAFWMERSALIERTEPDMSCTEVFGVSVANSRPRLGVGYSPFQTKTNKKHKNKLRKKRADGEHRDG